MTKTPPDEPKDEPQLSLFVPNYYNTTGERGEDLKDRRAAAKRQNEIVLEFFRRHPGGHTPRDAHAHVLEDAPLTSVRRAITVLTKKDLLEKTGEKRPGPLDHPELVWRLRRTRTQ